jgi:hypothetical protein
MGYRGSLGEIDLPTALQVFGRARRSGMLSVEGEGCSALIVLDDGRVLFASSDRVARIGERFVDQGLVTEEQLAQVLHMQRRKRTRRLIGCLLTDLGFVTPEQAASTVEDHIVAVLADTIAWPRAHVHFDECEGSEDVPIPPGRGDVDTLLMRAMVQGTPAPRT